MSEKLIIGLVGEMGSGKETFGKILAKNLPSHRVARFTFSHLLRKTLELWDIEPTRENLQKIARVMDDGFGEGTLTNAGKHQIDLMDADVIIIDGIRWESDHTLIRSFPRNILIYITADPAVRFERIRARGEKAGEDTLTWEQFLEVSQARNEVSIPTIGARADKQIENNSTLEDITSQARRCAQELI